MTVTRRSALAVLGLAPASAIASEDFSKQLGEGTKARFGAEAGPRIASALRKMADDIDAGGTLIRAAKMTSEVKPEDYLWHTLSIEFCLLDDFKPKA